MRRFIKATSPYLLFIVSILFWPNHVFNIITGKGPYVRDAIKLYDVRPNIDDKLGVILGSSTARCGINPEEISVNSIIFHNLASSAQTVEGSLQILQRLLELKTPDFLILDIYSNFYCRSSREFAFDYLGRNPLFNGIKDASFFFNQKDNYLFLVFIRSFIHGHMDNLTELENIRGHSTNAKIKLNETPNCETIFDNPQTINTESLIAITKLCQARNIKLIVTIPPDLCDFLHVDFQNHIQSINDSLIVIDGNLWAQRKPSFFLDDHHLNQDGAIAYSEWLDLQLNHALQQP